MFKWIKRKIREPNLEDKYMHKFKLGIGRNIEAYEDYPLGWIYRAITPLKIGHKFDPTTRDWIKTGNLSGIDSYGWHFYNIGII